MFQCLYMHAYLSSDENIQKNQTDENNVNENEKVRREYISTDLNTSGYLEIPDTGKCKECVTERVYLDCFDDENTSDENEVDELYQRMHNPDGNLNVLDDSNKYSNVETDLLYEEYNPIKPSDVYKSLSEGSLEENVLSKSPSLPPQKPLIMEGKVYSKNGKSVTVSRKKHQNYIELMLFIGH